MPRAAYEGKSHGSHHLLEIDDKEVVITRTTFWDDRQDRIPIQSIDAVSVTRSPSTATKLVLYSLVLSTVWVALAQIILWNVLEPRDLLLMLLLGVTFMLAAILIYVLGRPTRMIINSVGGTPYYALSVGALGEQKVAEILETITAVLPPR